MKLKILLLAFSIVAAPNVSLEAKPKTPKFHICDLISGHAHVTSWMPDFMQWEETCSRLYDILWGKNCINVIEHLKNANEQDLQDLKNLLFNGLELNVKWQEALKFLDEMFSEKADSFVMVDYVKNMVYILPKASRLILDLQVHLSDIYGAGEGRVFCINLFSKDDQKKLKNYLKKVPFDVQMSKYASKYVALKSLIDNQRSESKIKKLEEKINNLKSKIEEAAAEKNLLSAYDLSEYEGIFNRNDLIPFVADSKGWILD